MKTCIYCNRVKDDSCFSLEHVIPQFLGGALAPDEYKTKDVCKVCNNNLGLFVDASFEKSHHVNHELRQLSYSFFDPDNPTSLPLTPMGISSLQPPKMKDDEVCELWLGPFGEQIYWVRKSDERMYWYIGGNPRTAKSVNSRAYFFFSERSQKNPTLTWMSFRDAFEGRKVRKIMCTNISGADANDIGFSTPEVIDQERISYFIDEFARDQKRHNHFSMYITYDYRFLAKLAIGIGHVLFGEQVQNTLYLEQLRSALWYKEGSDHTEIPYIGTFGEGNGFLKEHCGVKDGVTISILPNKDGIALNLNINRKMNWVIHCAMTEDVIDRIDQKFLDGQCIIIFRGLNRCCELSMAELISHNNGTFKNQELCEVEEKAGKYTDYLRGL